MARGDGPLSQLGAGLCVVVGHAAGDVGLYTFVFGVVLKARWPGTRTGNLAEFGLMLFAGLTAFSLFSECVNRAPSLITASPNYVKKVVFPLEVLPVSVLGSALFHTGISVLILIVVQQVVSGGPVWTAYFFRWSSCRSACMALGISWVLASLGVFLRDIGHTVALVMQILFFMTPIFYAREALPGRLQRHCRLSTPWRRSWTIRVASACLACCPSGKSLAILDGRRLHRAVPGARLVRQDETGVRGRDLRMALDEDLAVPRRATLKSVPAVRASRPID